MSKLQKTCSDKTDSASKKAAVKPLAPLQPSDDDVRLQLEIEYWQALEEISQRENSSIRQICEAVEHTCRQGLSLSAAMRIFIFDYFYQASTETGHAAAGHSRNDILLTSSTAVH